MDDFKVGDIVIITPSESTQDYIERTPIYKKFVREKAKITEIIINLNNARVEYLNPNLTERDHIWMFKDLTLCMIEVSGEV